MRSIGRAYVALLAAVLGALTICSIGLGQVLINEVELNPPNNGTMWVELYNAGEQSVDISGWKVSIISTPWEGHKSIPEGTQIQANGFYVAEGDSRWAPVDNATVLLEDRQGNKIDLTPLLSDTSYNDFANSRIPGHWDSDTRADWAWLKATKGKPNSVSGIAAA
jgi:Lamin Tail Domain